MAANTRPFVLFLMMLVIARAQDNNAVDTNACEQREPDETRKGYNRSTRLCSPPILGCTNPCYLIPVPDFDDDCKKYAETLPPPYRTEWKDWKCCALDRECEKARLGM